MADGRKTGARFVFVGLSQRANTSAFGGASVVIANLAKELVARDVLVDVYVFASRDVNEFPLEFDSRMNLHYLRGHSRWMLSIQVVGYLVRSWPHVVVAVGTKTNPLCGHATRMPVGAARFWATLHQNLSSEMAGWSAHKRHRRIRLWRRVMDRSKGLIAVSRGVAEDFFTATGIDRKRVKVVYNPIVEPGLAARFKEPAEHPRLKDSGPPVILCVGRLTAQNDFATLVSAFALVRQRRPSRLPIIGEGEERGRLEALGAMLGVTNALDLAGFRPNPLPFLRDEQLLVMSSLWEGFGNVLVEALYCGTPVVSTDCPNGRREVLADGEFGRLVPEGDPRRLADAIVETLDAEPDADRLRARAEVFSAASSVDGYLDAQGLPLEGQ